MILHFLSDDKFSDYVISQFSGPEMCSEFVLMSGSGTAKYFQSVERVLRVNPYEKGEMSHLLASLKNYSAIVLHGLFYPWCETILRNVPENVKVAWMFWGGEVYGRSDIEMKKLAPLSFVVDRFHSFARGNREKKTYELPYELFRRVDYCLTGEEEEYLFVKRWLKTNIKHIWYTYYSIEDTLGELANGMVFGDGIIVGNSASIGANFFETLFKIKILSNKERNILLPLSYGAPWVRNSVRKFANKLFGDKAIVLSDYLPRNDYNRLLQQCSVMIMNHYRPQAQGNIITGLWLGMRVYLSKKSLAFDFFKRIGILIYSVEDDLKRSNLHAFAPLSIEEMKHNREVLLKWYSREHVIKSVKGVVTELQKSKLD